MFNNSTQSLKIDRKKLVFVFCLLSVLVPYFSIPFTERIRDYFLLKLLFILMAVLCCKKFPKIVLILFFPLITIFWGDLNTETLGVNGLFWVSYILYFIAGVNLANYSFSSILAFMLIAIEPIFAFITLGDISSSINGAYLIGYTLTLVILFSSLFDKIFSRAVFLFFALYSGIGRLMMLSSLVIFQIPRLNFLLGILAIIIMTYVTFATQDIAIYRLLLGYRISEYGIVFDASIGDLLFGRGLGTDLEYIYLGTKGEVLHGGRFHNFFLTLIFNYGIVFTLIIFLYLLKSIFNYKVKIKSRVLLIAWVLVAFLDGPRDGYWPIFITLGVLYGEGKTSHSYSSILSNRI